MGNINLWTNAPEVAKKIRNNNKSISESIKEGTRQQLRYREWEVDHSNWVMYVDGLGQYWDEVSGERLDKEGAIKAREEEMQEFRKHNVYTKVPIEECWAQTGKEPIGTKWVDVKKQGG